MTADVPPGAGPASGRMPARYHPALVALHWVMAAMILMALVAGGLVLQAMPNSAPEKVEALGPHMGLGLLIGALLLVRLLVRLNTPAPPQAATGSAALDRLGAATHWTFYVLILGMVFSGMAMAAEAGLFPIIFGGSGDPLPERFDSAARAAHGAISTGLLALIALHVAAAVYHQAVLRDGLLRRMGFGRRG